MQNLVLPKEINSNSITSTCINNKRLHIFNIFFRCQLRGKNFFLEKCLLKRKYYKVIGSVYHLHCNETVPDKWIWPRHRRLVIVDFKFLVFTPYKDKTWHNLLMNIAYLDVSMIYGNRWTYHIENGYNRAWTVRI